MASLRIVGIDPATSGANQLAAQGLDTVLINDIHGSTVLNLVASDAGGKVRFYAGGTTTSDFVLSLSSGNASFNPNAEPSFGSVTVAGGNGSEALTVTSPVTATKTSLVVTQLASASSALEVFGTGLALLQLGDPGTFLYNKTDSDMDLYTSGAGVLTINSGATGGTAITVDTNASGLGADILITAGASTSGANKGGPVSINGGSTNSTSTFDSGGAVTLTGGASTNAAQGGGGALAGGASTSGVGGAVSALGGTGATGGSASLGGGTASNGSNSGGSVFITAGDNSASSISERFGSLFLGATTTKDITIGGVSNAGVPGTLTVTGQSTTAGSGFGGPILITGGSTSSSTPSDSSGPVTITGGAASNAALGGDATLAGGASTSGTGGNVSSTGGSGVNGGDASLVGGLSTSGLGAGGTVAINAGGNSASSISDNFGSVTIGAANTKDITVGGVSNAGVPGTITITGQGTTAANNGGAVTFQGGPTTSTGGFDHGGHISLLGGDCTASAAGGSAIIKGGASTSGVGGSLVYTGGSGATGGGDIAITGGTCNGAGAYNGGDVVINAGDNTVVPTSIRYGSLSLGTSTTNSITMGGVSNSGSPGTISVIGNASTGTSSGGFISITSGACTGTAAGGSLALTGGSSVAQTGGPVYITGGTTDAASSWLGGGITIDAGKSTATDAFTSKGSILIGTQDADAITIGGVVVSTAAGSPGDTSLLGHTVNVAVSQKGGSVRIKAGDATGGNSSGGDVYIDPGLGNTSSANGIVKVLSQNGNIIDIGDGTVVPAVNIKDGYLSFTNTTSSSDSNPSATASTVKNTLYAKNTVSAWFLYGNGAIQDGFGLSSVTIVGADITVTFRHAAAFKWWQSVVVSGWDTGSVTSAYFVTVGGYTATTARLRLWRWSGAAIVQLTPTSHWFSMVRLANLG